MAQCVHLRVALCSVHLMPRVLPCACHVHVPSPCMFSRYACSPGACVSLCGPAPRSCSRSGCVGSAASPPRSSPPPTEPAERGTTARRGVTVSKGSVDISMQLHATVGLQAHLRSRAWLGRRSFCDAWQPSSAMQSSKEMKGKRGRFSAHLPRTGPHRGLILSPIPTSRSRAGPVRFSS